MLNHQIWQIIQLKVILIRVWFQQIPISTSTGILILKETRLLQQQLNWEFIKNNLMIWYKTPDMALKPKKKNKKLVNKRDLMYITLCIVTWSPKNIKKSRVNHTIIPLLFQTLPTKISCHKDLRANKAQGQSPKDWLTNGCFTKVWRKMIVLQLNL